MSWGGKKTHKIENGKLVPVENLISLANEMQTGDDGSQFTFSGDNGESVDFINEGANVEFDTNHYQNTVSNQDAPTTIPTVANTGIDSHTMDNDTEANDKFARTGNPGGSWVLDGHYIIIDMGQDEEVTSFDVVTGSGGNFASWGNLNQYRVEGSSTNSGPWDVLYNGDQSGLPAEAAITNVALVTTGVYRYYKITGINGGHPSLDGWWGEVNFKIAVPSNSANTIDTSPINGANTFSSSSLVVKNESGVNLSNSQLNVSDNIDGAGFGSLVSLNTFKALGNRVASTSYQLRLQIVGTESLKDVTVNTPQALVTINQNILEIVLDSVRKAAISSNSTVELDDTTEPTSPVDGIKIYSEGDELKYKTQAGSVLKPEENPSDASIETSYNNQVAIVDQSTAEAGASTTVFRWTPERVQQSIDFNAIQTLDLDVSAGGVFNVISASGYDSNFKNIRIRIIGTPSVAVDVRLPDVTATERHIELKDAAGNAETVTLRIIPDATDTIDEYLPGDSNTFTYASTYQSQMFHSHSGSNKWEA